MKRAISPKDMQACEGAFFQRGQTASIDVMERAARALADAIRADLPKGASIYFACGTGGNGGDGLACARMLAGEYPCTILLPRAPKSSDAITNLGRARACGIPIYIGSFPDLPRPDAWVDALFGTGLSRSPEGIQAELIQRVNDDHVSGSKVYAADIPSGLNGASGLAYPACIRADQTVTFQFLKWGHALADGLDRVGKLTIADVGFPEDAFQTADFIGLWEEDDIADFLPARPRNCHKGKCGHLLIVAGSFGMAGAAIMCASAALRSGVGLVTIACVKSIVPILQSAVPQAMCVPLEEQSGAAAPEAAQQVRGALIGKTAAVVGCGLSQRTAPEVVEAVLESGIPAVIDADALNLLAAHPEWRPLLKPQHVLTPHPGEARRLFKDLDTSDPVCAARGLQALGATVLFKGASCVISGDHTYISASGCCGMARGGSGDILSGILGALLADPRRLPPDQAAACASELHGLAGERAQRKYGSRAMNAMDILEFLPEVFPHD